LVDRRGLEQTLNQNRPSATTFIVLLLILLDQQSGFHDGATRSALLRM
jgi:hypothetical protein